MSQLYDRNFNTFTDLLVAIKNTCKGDVTSEHVKILIKLNFFRKFGEINALLNLADMFYTIYKSGDVKQYRNIKETSAKKLCIPVVLLEDYCERRTEKTFMRVDMFAILRHYERNYKENCPRRGLKDRIADQSEYLGYIDIIDKQRFANLVYVMSCVTTFSPRLQVYCLANGSILDVKVQKKLFNGQKIKTGDLVIIEAYKYSPKFKMGENGKWIKDYKEKELWINKYKIIEGNNLY